MGLFNFLKPKKSTVHDGNTRVIVGDSMIVRDTFKGFLENYDREIEEETASQEELAKVCYVSSYMFLPDLIHKRWPEFKSAWSSDVPFPLYLALTVASSLKMTLSSSQLSRFDYFEGKLVGETIEYFLIQYPALTQQGSSLGQFSSIRPFFAVVLNRPSSGERWLYILGQSPSSGTTLRCVTADGANCNCGPGPESSARAFLEAVQSDL